MTGIERILSNTSSVMTSTRSVLTSTRPVLMSTRPVLMNTSLMLTNTRSVLANIRPVTASKRPVLTNTGKMSVKKPQKTLKIELFTQNKPGVAKPIGPAHPGTGIGRVIAAMTGRRKRAVHTGKCRQTGLCSSPIGWEKARVRVNLAHSLAHRMGEGTGEG
jgi:hypothetical protein